MQLNEISLSNDLKQIEFEINYHKQVVGQSIWEIGRRLNHVKKNNLTHGEFGKWLEEMRFSHDQANKLMKIASELNSESTRNLGVEVLYLVATLPEEQKQEQLQKIEQGDLPTVREVKELKKQLKEKDNLLYQQQTKITELSNQAEKVIEKVVEVEIVPDDYEFLKQQSQQSNEKLEDLNRQYNALQKAYNDLSQSQSKQLENGKKYEELEKEIARLKGKMSEEQERIASLKETSKFFKQANEMLDMVAPLVFSDTYKRVANESMVAEKTRDLVARVEKWCKEMNRIIEQNETIEGEVIYD